VSKQSRGKRVDSKLKDVDNVLDSKSKRSAKKKDTKIVVEKEVVLVSPRATRGKRSKH